MQSKVPDAYCLGIFQNRNDETTFLGGMLCINKYLFIFHLLILLLLLFSSEPIFVE